MKSVYRIRTGVVTRRAETCHHVVGTLDRRVRVLHAPRPMFRKTFA